jgi:hypothetical protein
MPNLRVAATVCLVAGLLQAQPAHAQDGRTYDKVSFYFAAHEDDWQLFMSPSPFRDVADKKTKTVFVHLTAGDAGLGTGTGGQKHPYYLARENGADMAIRFMADAGAQPTSDAASRAHFNGHRIYRDNYRNTAAYFLRIPDGHPTRGGISRNRQPVIGASGQRRNTEPDGNRRLDGLSRLAGPGIDLTNASGLRKGTRSFGGDQRGRTGCGHQPERPLGPSDDRKGCT